MLSVRVRGGERAGDRHAARVELWKRATSLGGVESLVEHRASVEGRARPCPADLLRLSVGVEDAATCTTTSTRLCGARTIVIFILSERGQRANEARISLSHDGMSRRRRSGNGSPG